MKKIFLVIAALIIVTIAVHVITSAVSDVVQVKLRGHTFIIPKQIAMERETVMPDWLLNLGGLDDGSSTMLFRFDDQKIKEHVPNYQISNDNQFKDDVEGLIIALNPQEVNDYQNPMQYSQLADLWQSTGSFKNRKIEASEIPGWYKVYRVVEYPNSWMLINQLPDSEKSVPILVSDFWIASCLMQGPEGKRNGRCRTHQLIDDIVIEFSISNYNLHLLDEIKSFLVSQVNEWKQEHE